MSDKQPVVLLILDGWGYSESNEYNAIYHGRTPHWDQLWQQHPHALLHTSGNAVGLPEGQMGNSEVGHMNIGGGRVVYQNFSRINKAIDDGDFFTNAALTTAVDKAVEAGKAVHILGLLSPGGVHSHETHIYAACRLAAQRGASNIQVHAILDGRDTPPRSAEASLKGLDDFLKELGVGRLASLVGRYYAMDRDNRWDRVQSAYDLITTGKAPYSAESGLEALRAAYERDENDEFVQATLITQPQSPSQGIETGDSLLFMNFRPDRARQISRAFVEPEFSGFAREHWPPLADFVMLTEYAQDIPAHCAFPPKPMRNSLGEVLSKLGKTQLRIAETEKYAHVTFFFNGGEEQQFPGEERQLIASPQVATYDLKPEMSAFEVTEQLVKAIQSAQYDLIVCNYANGDMVGHTGVYEAAIKAVEVLDQCLHQVTQACLDNQAICLISADHGNVEQMVNPDTGVPLTSHTTLPVPLLLVGQNSQDFQLKDGKLADIAPTILTLMSIEPPEEMDGQVLLV